MLYVDRPAWPARGRLWSHLISDASLAELHVFAEMLGVPRRAFDRDHYDIPAERYDAVVAAGASPVTSRELIARLKAAGLRQRKSEALRPRPPGQALVRAPRLRPGDRVAVVSPSGPVAPERLAAGVAVLASWGLDPVVADHARGTDPRFGYLSADDATRAADLTAAWLDPALRAVVCARGGYGAQRMVDLLDWPALAAVGPKVLLGFSDVTTLHQAFGARLGLSTQHGPVVSSLGRADEPTRTHLRSMLLDPVAGTSLTPVPATALVPGAAEGVLVGGNLALLAAGVGTPGTMTAAGSIVVLEDVAEDLYRVDRLLTQLLRSGWFDGVLGVVLGDFTDCGSPAAVHDLALDRLGPLGVPVLAGVPFGHETRNLAFPLGVPAVLDADEGTLVLRDAALR